MATQNSPAMRCGLAGTSAGCCYGRFGGNRRTCQPNPSQNATGDSLPWQVIFDLDGDGVGGLLGGKWRLGFDVVGVVKAKKKGG